MNKRLADKVNVDDIIYVRKVHGGGRVGRTVVSFSKAAGSLHINSKMVELLNMKNWKQVIVGYAKKTGVIVLKHCNAEEFGSVVVQVRNESPNSTKNKSTRRVTINHLLKSMGLNASKSYKAERDGGMIFLEPIKMEPIKNEE